MPPAYVIRRRRAALIAAGVAAAIAGAALGAGGHGRVAAVRPPGEASGAPAGRGRGGADDGAGAGAAARSRAALERLAGSTVVLRFRGTTAPAYVVRALRRHRAAGVILFRDNVASPPQLQAMTAAFHRAAGGRALVMVDQEGGAIRNVPWAPPDAAPPAIATPQAAAQTARATAEGLRAAGVTVNLAPVADLGTAAGSIMRSRAFPGDSAAVGALVAATVRGYAGTGVLPVAKHFPGLGAATVNTDLGAATVAGGGDLAPFAAAVRAGVPLVMTSHALYPDLDPDRIASQSPAILTGLLRRRLGFRGVIITDSLEAKAVVGRTPTPVAAANAIAAGTDLLLTTGRGSYLDVLREVARRARASDAFRARLTEAVARVAALRRRLR